jgi:uncharacterized protein YjbI with pentapeptide repeats
MSTCVFRHLEWKCPHDSVAGKQYCIFHSPVDDKDPAEFWKHLASYLCAEYSRLVGDKAWQFYQTGRSWIHGGKDEELCQGYRAKQTDAYLWPFIGFIFPDMDEIHNLAGLVFRRTDFTAATFSGAGNFRGSDFASEACFSETQFFGPSHFAVTHFSGHANFRRARFVQGVNFESARFDAETGFVHARFDDIARFPYAQFHMAVDFRDAQFLGGADFSRVRFDAPAYFVQTAMHKRTCFIGTTLRNRVLLSGLKADPDSQILLWDADFVHGRSEFTLSKDRVSGEILEPAGEVVFRDISTGVMERVSFLHTEIMAERPRVRFINVGWSSNPRAFVLDAQLAQQNPAWLQSINPDGLLVPLAKAFSAPSGGEILLNLLRQDVERISREIRMYYEAYGSYSDAGNYHVAEMEFRRIRRGLRYAPLSRLALEVYRWVSNYGESPSMALGWLLIIWLVFAVGYMYTGFGFGVEETVRYPFPPQITGGWPVVTKNLSDFIHALGYSFANLVPGYFRSLTTGQCPGRYTPFLALVEGVLGIGVVTLFLLAVRRRFRR